MHGSASQSLRADVVLSGTGAGGAPVAARLAEAGMDLVVLEAGPRLEPAQLTGNEGEGTAELYTFHVPPARFSRISWALP